MSRRRGFAVVVAVLMLLLVVGTARAENPDWTKQLVAFTLEKSIGTTYTYDIDKHESGMGAKWNPIKAFGGYVSTGLFVYLNEPSLGGNVSLDIAKLVNRGREIPLNTESVLTLKNFDIGYWFVWTSLDNFVDDPFTSDKDGALGTVVKFSW